jgi:3-methyladenine DNA glycosylase/8-oxoguanine DNA glycosylase
MPSARAPYDLEVAVEHLRKSDARLAKAIDRVGVCSLGRGTSTPFEALLRSIVYQQLAGAAASTIHGRVLALLPASPPHPEHFRTLTDEQLRGAGLSRNKLAAVRDLVAHADRGEVPERGALGDRSDDEVVELFTRVRGIGRWTVEMMLMFELGRADILPVDDFGVRKGFSRVFGGEMPDKKVLAARGERWRPYRTVASWYLWRAAEWPAPKTRTPAVATQETAGKGPAKKAAAKKVVAKKAVSKKAVTKKATAKKNNARKVGAKKLASQKVASSKTARARAPKAARKKARR